MSKSIYYLLCLTAALAILMPIRARSAKVQGTPAPVLVELFTSEGCSSCPPADQLLQRIEKQNASGAPIIVMSEHVDYWDYLGWRDPFSNEQFSNRQRDYGRVFRNNGVYTPQMVVNGRVEFVGSDADAASREVRKASIRPSATVRVTPLEIETLEGGKRVATVQLAVGELPQMSSNDELEVMLAVTETGLRSKPRSGENRGESLGHTGVVRTLVKAGKVEMPGFAAKAKVTIDPAWQLPSLRLVAFVQEKKSRIVWGAGQAALEPPHQ